MFERYRTTGLVIKQENKGEADQLLTIYTSDFGKLVILGKAIRKINSKLRPAADIFCLSQIEFIQGRTYKTLTDAALIDKFSNLKKDFKKITVVHKMADDLDEIVRGQEPDKNIWQLLKECFAKLKAEPLERRGAKGGEVSLNIVYYYFFWNLISYLGYKPELFWCASCRKKLFPDNLYFYPREGGVICEECYGAKVKGETKRGMEITPSVVKILRLIIKKDWNTFFRLKIENSEQKLLKIISYSQLLYKRAELARGRKKYEQI